MSSTSSLKVITMGAIAVALLAFPAFAKAAQKHAVTTTEFSAEDQKKKSAGKPSGGAKQGGGQVKQSGGQPKFKQGGGQQFKQGGGQPKFKQGGGQPQFKQGGGQKNFGNQKNFGSTPKIITPNSGQSNNVKKVFTPKGANSKTVVMSRIRNAPAQGAFRTSIRGRNYSLWRSGYRARYRGGWRTFVALGTLGVLAVGAYEYYPYAYIDAPADYCDGQTEDGCQMVYDEVPTVEGDMAGQCVAYCPQQ